MKTKRSSQKKRTLVETIGVKNGVFLANEKQGNFSKRNLLGVQPFIAANKTKNN
jgi:small ligand-binding sensory domain FIST